MLARLPSSLFLPLFLALSLAFTSLSMAQARGEAAATGQMVICSGMGTTLVYVDAQGQPTNAPHICPDCLMLFSTDGADAPLRLTGILLRPSQYKRLTARSLAHLSGVTPPSRAPPLLV